MRRVDAIAFSSDGPVRSGYPQLADVTVLTGRNDSGKTQILRLIETALSDPEHAEMIDVFGTASADQAAELIDRDVPTRDRIDPATDPVEAFRDALTPAPNADSIRLAVRLPGFNGVLPVWRAGRSPSDLDDDIRERVEDALVAIPGRVRVRPEEPFALEHVGDASPTLLPEPVTVPSPAGAVERSLSAAIITLTRTLREVELEWDILDGRAGELTGGPPTDDSWSGSTPGEPDTDDVPHWKWLIREEHHATAVHPPHSTRTP